MVLHVGEDAQIQYSAKLHEGRYGFSVGGNHFPFAMARIEMSKDTKEIVMFCGARTEYHKNEKGGREERKIWFLRKLEV